MAELGAGMGLLSRHVLDALRRNAPDAYASCRLLVSDYADTFVQDVLHSGVFNDHIPHFQPVRSDIYALDKTAFNRPALVFMANLFSSLECRHLRVQDGQLTELLVGTYLSRDSIVTDGRHWPPKVLTETHLAELIRTKNRAALSYLAPKLAVFLDEAFTARPVSLQDEFSDEDRKLLSRLIPLFPGKGLFEFNFFPGLTGIFRSLWQQLDETALVAIYDFGYPSVDSSKGYKDLFVTYGYVLACPLFFPQVELAAEMAGFTVTRRYGEAGDDQVLLLGKNLGTKALTDMGAFFPREPKQNIETCMNAIWALPAEPEMAQAVFARLNTLSSSEKSDYFLLVNCAEKLLESGDYENALILARESLSCYASMGLSSYLISGQCYLHLDRDADAEAAFKQVLTLSADFPAAHLNLASLYANQKRYELARHHFTRFLRCVPTDYVWEQYVTLGLIEAISSRREAAKTLLHWLAEVADTFPGFVPEEATEKCHMILHNLEGGTAAHGAA